MVTLYLLEDDLNPISIGKISLDRYLDEITYFGNYHFGEGNWELRKGRFELLPYVKSTRSNDCITIQLPE